MAKNNLKLRILKAVIVLAAVFIFANIRIVEASVFDWLNNYNVGLGTADLSHGPVVYLGANGIASLDPISDNQNAEASIVIIGGGFVVAQTSPVELPKTKTAPVKLIKEMIVPVTAYSSTVDQTDESPFITAMGSKVRDGIVAANFLPFGTKLKIPDIFGDKIFLVEDRMNPRYHEKIDIWFPDRESALEFGLKILKIQIVES